MKNYLLKKKLMLLILKQDNILSKILDDYIITINNDKLLIIGINKRI